MKLLSWMHTIKQNVLNPSKEFKGVCCLRAHVSSQVQDIRTNSFSFSGPSHDTNPYGVQEELPFHGFLSIGTLGRDPETPKFAATVVQEEMSKLITEKLDKFLEEYLEDTMYKRVERSDARDGESKECTQQGYDLFRSSKDQLVERSNNEVKKKKGLLTSLFKGRQTLEGECSMKKHGTKYLIKRMFKKLHGSSSKTRNDDNESMSKKKDLRKSAQIFRSKVHPFLSTHARDDKKIDERRSCINRCDNKVPSLSGRFLGSSFISEANKKGEKWIKTDTEYLVLEL